MRKSREEAARTRGRIVEAASRGFREHGVVATGLNDLMKAAGLTHGGFYKHFESKDRLVAEAIVRALEAMVSRLTAAGASPVAIYLSAEHRATVALSPRSAASSAAASMRPARRRRTAS